MFLALYAAETSGHPLLGIFQFEVGGDHLIAETEEQGVTVNSNLINKDEDPKRIRDSAKETGSSRRCSDDYVSTCWEDGHCVSGSPAT